MSDGTAFHVQVAKGDLNNTNKASALPSGWQWKFQTVFGQTHSYMSHNDAASAEAKEEGKKATHNFPIPNFEAGLVDDSPVWERYLHESQAYDKDIIDHWNGNMDVLLVFTGLFSGILTAFIIEFYRTLQPDPSDQSVAFLKEITVLLRCQQNQTTCPSSSSSVSNADPNNLLPSTSAWVVNLLWFTSLTLTLTISLLVLFAKQWIRAYKTDAAGPRHSYVRRRQFKLNGMKDWHLPILLNTLPQMLFVALIMFLIGLVILLQTLDERTFLVCLVIVLALILFSLIAPTLPAIYPGCPFHTVDSGHVQLFNDLCRWYYHLRDMVVPPKRRSTTTNTPEKVDKTQLDVDALEWLISHADDQKTVDMALHSISAITSNVVFRNLGNDKVAKLLISRIKTLCAGELSTKDANDITYYLQAVYLVLLNGHPFTDVWATAYLDNLGKELHEVLTKLRDIPGDKPWETSGVLGLFTLYSIKDCNWLMEEIYADGIHEVSNNTLYLAMTRLYALHIQEEPSTQEEPWEMQGHASIRLLLRFLCYRVYNRDLASLGDDRLVKLGILLIHFLVFERSQADWHRKQYHDLDTTPFEGLLPQSLVKIFSHYKFFGLKKTACGQLWDLMQRYLEQHNLKAAMLLTYNELSSNERHTFFSSLYSVHAGVRSAHIWQRLINFLSLPLGTYDTPPEGASELVVQYLLLCNLETSQAHVTYDILRNMSTHVSHCKYLLTSRAWSTLIGNSKTVYLAMNLIQTTLYTLIHHISPLSRTWENIDAARLFLNLNHYFQHLEDDAPEIQRRQGIVLEWLGILNVLSYRYKEEIIRARLPQVVLGLPGTDDVNDTGDFGIIKLLTLLNKSLKS